MNISIKMRFIKRIYFEFFFWILKANVFKLYVWFDNRFRTYFRITLLYKYYISHDSEESVVEQNRKTTIVVIEHNYIRIFITTTQIWVLSPVHFNEKNYLTDARSRLMKTNFLGFLFDN